MTVSVGPSRGLSHEAGVRPSSPVSPRQGGRLSLGYLSLANSCEALVEVGEDVVDVFDAYGEADEGGVDADGF